MKTSRERFGSRFTVIMAMAGSAVGLGNIWRFPYIVGEYGGAAFVLVYCIACFILALPIFFAETIIGRRSGSDTFGAMHKLAPGTNWKWLGLLTVISPMIVLGYYSVVGGWSVAYLFRSAAFYFTTSTATEVTAFFPRFISSTWAPLAAHTLFIALTTGVILGGVKNGIEKFTKYTMPLLFLLIVIIAVYSISLPGAQAGVAYLLKPDFSKLNAQVIAAAMGQAFFSLSLGVGTILTYASYIRKEENLLASGIGTGISDLLFALLAGLAIMPAVFAAGIAPGTGPGLVFETLPFIFNKMGAGLPLISGVMAFFFFFSVLMAALTSSISLMEVGVAYLSEEKGMKRRNATLAVALFTWTVGILCSLSFGPLAQVQLLGNSIFDFMDKLCSNWLMPIGGLLFTIFAGWKMSRADVQDEFTNGGRYNRRMFGVIYFLIRYFAPVGIIVVFFSNLLL